MYGNHDAETQSKKAYSEFFLDCIATGKTKYLVYKEDYVEVVNPSISSSDEGRYGNFVLPVYDLDDKDFVEEYKTTKIIALRRIGILMTTEENEAVLKELKENLYHLQEVKQGFLNPLKYYKEINNRDKRLAENPKSVIPF